MSPRSIPTQLRYPGSLYYGRRGAALSGFARIASQKLDQIDAATGLSDLPRSGNRLEALKGSRAGQRSTRINEQR